MSDSTEQPAIDPEALTAAVAASHAAPAPADALEQALQSVTSRLSTLEAHLPSIATVENAVASHGKDITYLQDQLAAEVPSLAPVISRLEALETWAMGIMEHFQGKVPPLPPSS